GEPAGCASRTSYVRSYPRTASLSTNDPFGNERGMCRPSRARRYLRRFPGLRPGLLTYGPLALAKPGRRAQNVQTSDSPVGQRSRGPTETSEEPALLIAITSLL